MPVAHPLSASTRRPEASKLAETKNEDLTLGVPLWSCDRKDLLTVRKVIPQQEASKVALSNNEDRILGSAIVTVEQK